VLEQQDITTACRRAMAETDYATIGAGAAEDPASTTTNERKREVNESWVRTQLLAVMYGVVATAMAAPVMMSFASIIFSDPFFAPYLPSLVKLVLFSAAVHQICYVLSSTMDFAVGQVQDAGLIFLSAMARTVVDDAETWRRRAHAVTNIVEDAVDRSGGGLASLAARPDFAPEDDVVLASALWLLGMATAALGLMLVLVGKLRLASLAQFLPVPVVGGYLAYIGFYCGQAGLGMMAGVQLLGLRDWPKLLTAFAARRIGVVVVVWLAIKGAGRRSAGRSRAQGVDQCGKQPLV